MDRSFELVGIDHVQLAMPACGEDDARRFYVDLLGLVELAKPPELAARGGCWFADRAGTTHVHLGVEDDFRPASKAHPALVARDLDALREHLRRNGFELTGDVAIPGVSRFYTFDPFGNRLEFVAEPDRGFSGPSGR